MRAGQLNKTIVLQEPTRTADGMGGSTETWSDNATIWAAIWPISANEVIRSSQAVMEISHRIRIRYRSGVLSSWRIKFGARYFNIISIINKNESNEYLDIMAKETV